MIHNFLPMAFCAVIIQAWSWKKKHFKINQTNNSNKLKSNTFVPNFKNKCSVLMFFSKQVLSSMSKYLQYKRTCVNKDCREVSWHEEEFLSLKLLGCQVVGELTKKLFVSRRRKKSDSHFAFVFCLSNSLSHFLHYFTFGLF